MAMVPVAVETREDMHDYRLLVHLIAGALNAFRRQRFDDPASHVLVFTAWLCTPLGGTGMSYLLQTHMNIGKSEKL